MNQVNSKHQSKKPSGIQSRRYLELVIAPIVAGVMLHILNNYAIPWVTESEGHITVSIQAVSTIDNSDPLLEKMNISPEQLISSYAYMYQFQIRNDGDIHLKDVELNYVFDDSAEVLGHYRSANPHADLWDIKEQVLSPNSRKIIYQSFNPEEVVTEFLVLNRESEVNDVISRSPEFSLTTQKSTSRTPVPLFEFLSRFPYQNVALVISIFLIFLVALLLTKIGIAFLPIKLVWYLYFETDTPGGYVPRQLKEVTVELMADDGLKERRVPISVLLEPEGWLVQFKVRKGSREELVKGARCG